MKKLIHVLLLFCVLCSGVAAQDSGSDEQNTPVVVPAHAMKDVVRRVLTWSFRPAKKPKIINLADQFIDGSWLPDIKNIEFRVLTPEQARNHRRIYFFTKPERKGAKFDIGFVYGTLNCDYAGDWWAFRMGDRRVRLWLSGQLGAVCSHDEDALREQGGK